MPFDTLGLSLEYGYKYERTLARREEDSTLTSSTPSTGVDTPQKDEEKVVIEKTVEAPSVAPGPKPQGPEHPGLWTSWNPFSWIWPTSNHSPTTTRLPAPPSSTDLNESYNEAYNAAYNDADNVPPNTLEFILGPEQFGSPFWWVSGMVGTREYPEDRKPRG